MGELLSNCNQTNDKHNQGVATNLMVVNPNQTDKRIFAQTVQLQLWEIFAHLNFYLQRTLHLLCTAERRRCGGVAGRGGVIARQLPAGLQTGNGSRYRRILPDALLEQTNGNVEGSSL